MKKFFGWCKRYISIMSVLVIGLVLYSLFWQENSIFKYREYSQEIKELKEEIKTATDTLEYYREMNQKLRTDPETMEREGRENFYMIGPDEDIYVFTD